MKTSAPLIVPANLKQPCPDQKELTSTRADAIYKHLYEKSYEYKTCATSKALLIELIEEYNKGM